MLYQLVFNSVVLYPILGYVVKRKDLSHSHKLAVISAFIALVAIAISAWKVQSWDENYFRVLGVPRDAEARDIKQAYRRLSIELHPDKNPHEAARERFLLVTKAQNALLNNETRDAYDRFGPEGLKWVESSQSVYSNALMGYIIEAFMNLVAVYVLTAGVSSTNARSYSYGAMGVICAVVASMRFGHEDLYVPFSPSMTRHEKCELLSGSLSLIVMAIGVWQRATYFDWEEAMLYKLREIEVTQRALLVRVSNDPSSNLGGGGGRGGSAIHRGTNAPGGTVAVPDVLPPPQRFQFPEIPGWLSFLLLIGVSHLLSGGGGNEK